MLNVLLFLSTYCSGIVCALVYSHIYIFVVYQAIYFFNPLSRWWSSYIPSLSYSLYAVVIMMGLFLLNFRQYNKNSLLKVPQIKYMYLLLLLYTLASFYAVLPASHNLALNYYAKLIITMSIAYKLCDTDKKLNIILYGYIYGAWYISFVAFQTGRNYGGRVEGIGTVDSPDANGLAAAIAPSLVLCLYYFWISNNIKVKVLIAIAGAFIANAIVLINSRGSFLAVVASGGYFMYYMYFSRFKRNNQKKMAVFITIFGSMALLYVVDDSFIERMSTLTTQSTNDTERETGATRFIFWQSAWEMAKDHPFGAGNRGFDFYAPYYIPKNVHTGGQLNRSVHSTWFEALSEIGYPGLLTLIMMIYMSFRTTKKCKKQLQAIGDTDTYFKIIAIEATFIAFIVAMTFMNRMRAEILYWCVLFTACAYNIYVLKPALSTGSERSLPLASNPKSVHS